jgi:membrane-associated phospholipid phosphatase
MTKSTATILSTVGHPFVLLPVVLSLLTVRQLSFEEAWPALAAILGSIAIMGAFLIVRKRKGKISNWDVSAQSERASNIYRPALMLLLVTAVLLYIFRQPFVGETLFFALLMAVCYAINTKIKISQHTLMATYLGFLVLSANFWAGVAMLVFAPFVAWSRVVLGRHTLREVLVGGLVATAFGVAHILLFR